ARIRRSMLLVTASAALHAHGRVLESEWAALVAVAFETAGFVGCEQVHHARAKGAVRIVTIRAGHSSFRKPVPERPLELAPRVEMTCGALLVDVQSFSDHKAGGAIAMNRMTADATYLVTRMAALNAPGVRRLVEVAFQADLIGAGGREPPRVADVVRRSRFDMRAPRSMASLAALPLPRTFLARLESPVGTFPQSIENIFVAGLARFGAGIGSRGFLRRSADDRK